ncbi:MAG: hypothetical protein KBA31_08815 [Alphaproteobacteria bacterium]|nr:hypothetical protein [Alphaproteobacteria bacterium]
MRAILFTASLVATASIVAAAPAAPPHTAALIVTLQADKARLSHEAFDRAFQEKYQGKPFQDTGTIMEFEEDRWLFGVSYFAPVATAHGEVRCALSADDIAYAVAAKTGDRVRVQATLAGFTDRIEIAQCKFKVLGPPATARPPALGPIAAQIGSTATPPAVTGRVFADLARQKTDSDRDALLNGIQGKPFADNGFVSAFADGWFCRLYRSVQLQHGRVYCCLTARDLRPFAQFRQGQNVRIYGKVTQWTPSDGSIELNACRIERR